MDMSCILCGNVSVNLFEINEHTKDDIVELFGARNGICIEENQFICKPCQKMLEKLAQLKRRLRYLILRPCEDRKPVDLRHIWKLFASFQLDTEGKEKRSIPTPNPSVLFTVSDCEDFSENKPKRKPRRRKSEKRGHGWTRRKRSSSAASITNRPTTRASTRAKSRGSTRTSVYTPFSTLSGFSNYESSRPNTPYSEISNLTATTRRSQRRAARVAVLNEKEKEETSDSNILYCPFKKCSLYYMSLDKLNYHVKMYHKTPELFNCTECAASFCLEEHLKIHSKIHDFSPFFCLMCAEPQENRVKLQNHLDRHMLFSAPCVYCDKSFLTERQLKTHYKEEHPKVRSQKIAYQKKSIMIVFKKNNLESNNNEDLTICPDIIHENQVYNTENTSQQTEQEPIANNQRLQTFFGKDYNVCIVPQLPKDLDVTFENFNLENVEFFVGEGYEVTEDEIHMDTERDENATTEDETGNLRSELDSTIAENGSEIDRNEEIEAIIACEVQEPQGSNNKNDSNDNDDSSTRPPLVNGFSYSNDSEVMDVGNSEENDTAQENPS